MKLNDILIESVTLWIPDGPQYTKKCEWCDEQGIADYWYKSYILGLIWGEFEHNTVDYPGNMTKLRDQMKHRNRFPPLSEKNVKRMLKLSGLSVQDISNLPEDERGDVLRQVVDSFNGFDVNNVEQYYKELVNNNVGTSVCDICNGTHEQPDFERNLEVNMTNRNASLVLDLLGVPTEQGMGEIKYSDIPAIRRTMLQLRQKPEEMNRTHGVKSTVRGGGTKVQRDKDEYGNDRIRPVPDGPTIYDQGVDADYFLRKFDQLMPLLDYAYKNKKNIAIG